MASRIRRNLLRLAGLALVPGVDRALACEFEGDLLRVIHPWTRATPAGASSAVLCMRIEDIVQSDRLIGAETPVAAGVEMAGPEAGRPVDVALPAGQVVELDDAGLHLRLTGLRHALHPARTYPLDLHFERSGTVLARLTVEFPTQRFR